MLSDDVELSGQIEISVTNAHVTEEDCDGKWSETN